MLALASVSFFIYQWNTFDADVWGQISLAVKDQPLLATTVFVLMLFNWYFESVKFRVLLRTENTPSKIKAFFTVLGGTTISNFTPARTGDYIGRSILLKHLHPIKVILATVTGNILQLLTTYFIGSLCFVLLLFNDDLSISLGEYSTKLIWAIGVIVGVLLVLYYAPKIYRKYKDRLPNFLQKGLRMISLYTSAIIGKAAFYSFLRYLSFSIQFYLLLSLFATHELPLNSLVFIPVAYLLQSLVPVPAVADIGVRVMFSSLLFGALLSESEILLAVTSLWFINLIFPALLGSIYLLFSLFRKD